MVSVLALSVTFGATLPLLSLRDIFPRPGEVFPQRERLWQYGKVSRFAKGSPFGRAAERSEAERASLLPVGITPGPDR